MSYKMDRSHANSRPKFRPVQLRCRTRCTKVDITGCLCIKALLGEGKVSGGQVLEVKMHLATGFLGISVIKKSTQFPRRERKPRHETRTITIGLGSLRR